MTVRAKKHLGQHFLNDEDTPKNIADSLSGVGYDTVLEIGPGMGVLTKYLLESEAQINVIEIDRDSVAYLNNDFKNEHQPKRIILDSNLRIVGDENILKLPGEKYIYSLKKDHNESQIRNIIRTTKEIEGKLLSMK